MTALKREDLLTRAGILALVVLIAASLSPNALILLYIVLGYPHFMMALWYARDRGALGTRRAVIIGLLALVLPFVALWMPRNLLIAGVGLFFGFHFAIDEIRLLGSTYRPALLLPLGAFLAVYAALLTEYFTGVSYAGLVSLGALALIVAWRAFFSTPETEAGGSGLALWTIALAGMHAFMPVASAVFWFGIIALSHYAIWYVVSLKKEVRAGRGVRYGARTFYTHAVALLAFLAVSVWSVPFFSLLFLPVGFYGITFLHIATSLRPKDLRQFASGIIPA